MPIKNDNKNFNNIIEIEITAERLCFAILGDESDIKYFIDNISPKYKKNRLIIANRLLIPIINIAEEEMKKNNILIDVSKEIEHIQCSIICDCNHKEEKTIWSFLLLEKIDNNYILKYPEIDLIDNIEPEKAILQYVKNMLSENIIKHNIDSTKLKLIDIAGKNEDILVYSLRINKLIKKL